GTCRGGPRLRAAGPGRGRDGPRARFRRRAERPALPDRVRTRSGDRGVRALAGAAEARRLRGPGRCDALRGDTDGARRAPAAGSLLARRRDFAETLRLPRHLAPPPAEGAVRHVRDADAQLVAREALAEVRHVETDAVVMRARLGGEVDLAPRGVPGPVEDELRDVVQEVPVDRAAPIQDRGDPIALHEHIAVHQIVVDEVTRLG